MTSFALLDNGLMLDSDGNVYGAKVNVDGNGYRSVWVSPKRLRLHRMVAETFIPNPEGYGKPDVAHWDGDKANNAASNLRWATKSENNLDKRRHRTNRGGLPKLKWPVVDYIRESTESQRKAARELGVSQSLVSLVRNNKIWKEEFRGRQDVL